ncbi:hypothetical protein C2G38_2310958 [Gigaspora rosea]|uniref:CCHC-type domain-containing protein n=1 Tax=Gigaspora rosea TaxID=44941 RepID=A0A397V9A0_9GLOM|nr:hypothetical protein C2G38_2310958 [Gigaspora rosea]
MSKQSAQLEQYGGGITLAEIPSHGDIISEYDNGLTAILQQSLSDKQPIYFMPNDMSDVIEYIKNVLIYILCIHGTLINGQKARLVKIISGAEKIDKSKFGIKVTHAYPIRGYNIEKKAYIHIITWNHYDRTLILKKSDLLPKPVIKKVEVDSHEELANLTQKQLKLHVAKAVKKAVKSHYRCSICNKTGYNSRNCPKNKKKSRSKNKSKKKGKINIATVDSSDELNSSSNTSNNESDSGSESGSDSGESSVESESESDIKVHITKVKKK